jgi:hypothetical protein
MVGSFLLSKSAARVGSATLLTTAALLLAWAPTAQAQLANVKVVTDANPDYSDMESMVRSITHNWKSDKEKMWPLFYWDHIARRQTSPISLHGMALTDPIRQYNDYGYTMCSTISGIKCSTWNYMGYPNKYYDIGLHTVPEVWYDGAYHHYDNSLSVIYTLCDGKTIAGIEDVGATRGCAASGGKEEPGHVAIYHALNGTSVDGFLEGADTMRDLRHLGVDCFSPGVLKYRFYLYDQDRGHRYILNLRDGEVYARHYSRQDKDAAKQSTDEKFKSDPDYFIPNGVDKNGKPIDPESANPRYRIRGNGIRTWKPPLDNGHLAGVLYSGTNVKGSSAGLEADAAGQPAEAVFKVEGANVITSVKADAEFENAAGVTMSLSTDNGLSWKDVWKGDAASNKAALKFRDEVNGQYDALVKVTIPSQAASAGAKLKSIEFNTITALNAKTQPQLKLGKNTVYVGTGEQTESIVVWPDLQAGRYKPYVVEEKNLGNVKEHVGYQGAIYQESEGQEAYVVFKVDSPTDMTGVTYGGRLYNRAPKSHIDFEHSFDGGKTWTKSYSLEDTNAPWDVIHYETVTDIPKGTRSVLFKYTMNGSGGGTSACSIYAVRMEVNHALQAPSKGPVEVTFDWSERQEDYKLVQRSHTQVVDKLPATYTINVGGADHPVVNALTVNFKGARGGDVKSGYSDGKDAGGEKVVGKWATYGKNLLVGKPYTVSIPSGENWDAGDPEGKKLTDGRVGSSYNGGTSYREGLIWSNNQKPEIVVDMGENKDLAAFRIHLHGYEYADPIKGEVKDKVEVLTSADGKTYTSHGEFDLNLFWKDIPVNYMWTDEETFYAHNHLKALEKPVNARYVKYVIDCKRFVVVTEVQALDGVKFEPFDLKIALPDPASNGKAPPNATISPNARKFAASELPDDIGKPRER